MHQLRLPIATLASLALTACVSAPTPSPADSGVPVTTAPSPTGRASGSPAGTASASPSATGEPVLGEALECENQELGYEVDYPEEWWANERIEPEDEDLTPIAACQYFAPSPIELQPNAGLPNGLAIWFQIPEEEAESTGELLSEETLTIDGHDAVVTEIQPEPSEGFVPEGSLIYRYEIQLSEGRRLVASTDNILQDDSRYQESKPILDAMMATLEIEDD
jgi:hypothetical protein